MSSYLASLMQIGQWFALFGPPGCAKTARIIAAAKESKRKLFLGIGGRTADLMDRVDIGGAIVPDVANQVSHTLPLTELKEILECTEPAVWFIDELPRATIDVQGGICSVLDRIKARNRAGLSNMQVVAAGNRQSDKAGSNSLQEQIRSRIGLKYEIAGPETKVDDTQGSVTLMPYYEERGGVPIEECEVMHWVRWAQDVKNADPRIIAYHRSTKGTELYRWKPSANPSMAMADFRTWETVIDLFAHGIEDRATIGATIGRASEVPFRTFCQLADDIPTQDEMIMDPEGCRIPTNAGAMLMVATMFARNLDAAAVKPFITYINRFPRLYAALALTDAWRKHSKMLSLDKTWAKWWQENQELFLGAKASKK